MATLIKTQLVKQLSRFTKNLSPDKIQLSTLKGEGELTNLELNEEILMELMDLPTWLTLNKAVCNKVNIKIQWSKLKSQPIELFLDEVHISMEMCETLRDPPNTSGLPSYSSGGKYGFGDRVVDGMSLYINAVVVDFTSKAFRASINLSRISIQSKTPNWKTASDLLHTRISEKQNDLLLTFKEVSWQTLKVEADCMVDDKGNQTTPLRLITNQSKIRISVKKRYSDCSTVATKLQFIMDDLLWIVTDSQMKAAVVFATHLKDNIDKASEQSKEMAARHLQKQKQTQRKSASQTRVNHRASPVSALFERFDIAESSYHVETGRIDLHICDDINTENRNRLVDGGAVGIAVMRLQISHYPMRPAGKSRQGWPKYDDNMQGRDDWTSALISNYIQQLKLEKKAGDLEDVLRNVSPDNVAKSLVERLTMLTVEDFYITTVSCEKEEGNRPPKLLMSDKKALHLPADMPAVHVEQTDYFFDHTTSLPTPCPNVYVRVNPIKLSLDTYTITWFNSFALSLAKDVDELLKALPLDTEKKKVRMEMRMEALMPKIVLPVAGKLPPYQHDRPQGVQVLISRLVITNNHCTQCSRNSSMEAHKALIKKYSQLNICNSKHFPNQQTDISLMSEDHHNYAHSGLFSHLAYPDSSPKSATPQEMMSIELEQFWMEFIGVKNAGSRPVSFLESFPVTVWLTVPGEVEVKQPVANGSHQPLQRLTEMSKAKATASNGRHMSVLVDIGGKVCAQLNHYQFCFLMRLADSFTAMGEKLSEEVQMHRDLFSRDDGKEIIPTIDSSTVVLQLKEVQFALLAKPGVNASGNTETTDGVDSPGGSEQEDISSISPTSSGDTAPDTPDHMTVPADRADVPHIEVSPTGSDSGIASVATPSYSGSADIDPQPHSRSSFHASDTLIPPAAEQKVGSKISSVFGKVTSKVKNSINKVMDEGDNLDSMSIMSGLSDDFDLLAEISGQEEEVAFVSKQVGGLNDDDPESFLSNSMATRPKQMFSVTVFKLCGIQVGLHTVDKDMVAKVTVQSLHNEDKGNIYYDDFQAQQLTDMNRYTEVSGEGQPIKIRFSQGPAAADLADGAQENGFAHIRVSDYSLSFLSSTIDKLGPVFKDEQVGKPLPMLIEVSAFDLHLQDDALPAYNTDSPNVPISLHVDQVSLTRGMDGVFTVLGGTIPAASSLKKKSVSVSDKATNTVAVEEKPAVVKEAVQRVSSVQLLEEMRHLQEENRTLQEQILRLNNRLIEKDHIEFERVESSGSEDVAELRKELESYKNETRTLRNQN